MKKLTLTNGHEAIVDDDDYDRLSVYSWHVQFKPNGRKYALRGDNVMLHRIVMGMPPADNDVDHINRDGLDCRKSNLRIALRTQNNWNATKRSNTKSKYKGVSRHVKGSWFSRIGVYGKDIYLGHFKNEVDAALAYDAAARKYCGQFARLNFPEGTQI
jgi:hypothetical protein